MNKTVIIIMSIWTMIWIGFGIMAIDELWYWPELSHHSKIKAVQFAVFVPLAWIVGGLKILLIYERHK